MQYTLQNKAGQPIRMFVLAKVAIEWLRLDATNKVRLVRMVRDGKEVDITDGPYMTLCTACSKLTKLEGLCYACRRRGQNKRSHTCPKCGFSFPCGSKPLPSSSTSSQAPA
jgi:hypothetical protein